MDNDEPLSYDEMGELMARGMKTISPNGMYDLGEAKTSSIENMGNRDYAPEYMIKAIEAKLTAKYEGEHIGHRHIWEQSKQDRKDGIKRCSVKIARGVKCPEIRQRD